MESTTSATKARLVRERQFLRSVWWTVFFVSPPIAIAIYALLWKAVIWVVGGAW